MKKIFVTGLSLFTLSIALNAQTITYQNEFTTAPVISDGSGAFTHTSDGANWIISSPAGHGEYDQFDIEFPSPISFTGTNKPIVSLKASSDQTIVFEVSLIDTANHMSDNPVTLPNQPNRFVFEKDTAPKVFSYDFTGHFKDNYSNGGAPRGAVDSTQIARIRFRINTGFASPYPFHKGQPDSAFFKVPFKGNIKIDALQIGEAITDLTGIFDASTFGNSVNIYPNPSTGLIHVSFDSEKLESLVSIVNTLGQEIVSARSFGSGLILNMSEQEKGMYFIKIQSATGSTAKRLIIK